MRLGIKHIVFAMLVLNFLVCGNLWAANSANMVEVNGDRLSVHAEGIPLGELLMAIEDKTGVQFTFDELVTTKEVSLDFRGLPLSEGIRRIIHSLSWATIYDDTGKLRKVFILEQWKGPGTKEPLEERDGSAQAPRVGLTGSIAFPLERDSNSSGESKGHSPGKGPVYSDDSPVDKAHSEVGPPDKQDEIPEDLPLPSVACSVHVPIPDSKGAPVEVAPVDTADSEGAPPNTQDEIPENLPIPGVTSPDHVPIPDYEGL